MGSLSPESPSIVVTSPSTVAARQKQESTRTPSTSTVQAPHWPWSHPFLVPVSASRSRSASSKVTRGSSSSRCSRPFTFSTTCMGPSHLLIRQGPSLHRPATYTREAEHRFRG